MGSGSTGRLVLLFAAVAAVSAPASGAQPVTERTPNLEGTWVTSERNLHFTFSHRFEVVGGNDVDVTDLFGDGKVVAYPTFALTYGLPANLALGFRYSSNSLVAGGPNEWQPYLKWAPLRLTGDDRLSLSLKTAWNGAAQSVDGELAAQARLGRLGLLAAARGFSDSFDRATGESDASLALAAGATLRLTRHLSLAADVTDLVSGVEGEPAWSAGLQVGIPYTPHTFSLLATNVTSGTLQGASVGVPGTVYWGFEFTVPFSGFARWGEVLDAVPAEPTRPPAATGRRVVEVEISDSAYEEKELRVPPGTTVRWVNRDPVGHTVTADGGAFGSPLIGPGEVFERTFTEPGGYSYHCIPHPFMKAAVTVLDSGGGAADGGRR